MSNFGTVRTIKGKQTVTTTAISISVNKRNFSLQCKSGTLWVRHDGVAADDEDSWELVGGEPFECQDADTVSVISDAAGAEYQYIIWED